MKNKFYFKEYLYDKLTGQLMTNMDSNTGNI